MHLKGRIMLEACTNVLIYDSVDEAIKETSEDGLRSFELFDHF